MNNDNKDNDNKNNNKNLKLIFGIIIYTIGIIIYIFFKNKFNNDIILIIFTASYLLLGGDVIRQAMRNLSKGLIFDENFLMSIATIGAFLLGEYPEAAGVMLFYQVGEMFQEMAVNKSKKSIIALMNIRPDHANVKKNGEIIKTTPDAVKIGDVLIVKPGEKIPLDAVVIEGESYLDTSALTGESVPRGVKTGDNVLSGCVNQNGLLTVKAVKTAGESSVSKIIELVMNASQKKAPTEKFITKFSRYYTPVVTGLAILIAVIPTLLGLGNLHEWIRRGLIFLVISCPCALVISIPLGYFGGIGGASRKGILVKGGNYLDALAKLDIVVLDKTGTLTKGVFKVQKIITSENFTSEKLLEYTAKAEIFSNHPIAHSIIEAYGKEIDKSKIINYKEIPGQGIIAEIENKRILAGNEKLMTANKINFIKTEGIGTKLYSAIDNLYAGCMIISDELKDDSAEAVSKLKELGVKKTVMLTGDNSNIAEDAALKLKIDEYYGDLLPAEKTEKVEMLLEQKKSGRTLAFIGDGINDAPSLARADAGIAMGALGSDAAIEAADIVLMTDEPSKLIQAIKIARKTRFIVRQNIILALGVKFAFLILGAIGIATMWEAVFADVGIALLAILNATRAISVR